MNSKPSNNLQGRIDSLPLGATLPLLPHYYEGEIVIKRPLILDGHGATIMSHKAPVLTIQSNNVVLRNLKVKIANAIKSNDPYSECAIFVEKGWEVVFENVEVRGSIIGLPVEEGLWRYPQSRTIEISSNKSRSDLIIPVHVPVRCSVVWTIPELDVTPSDLEPGHNEIRVRLLRDLQDDFLRGEPIVASLSARSGIGQDRPRPSLPATRPGIPA